MITDAQLAEWREEWRREAEMLAFYDADDGLKPGKSAYEALALKFGIPQNRVARLIQKHNREQAAEREAAERQRREDRMEAELRRLKWDTFESKAERLWLDLAWLVMEIEARRALQSA